MSDQDEKTCMFCDGPLDDNGECMNDACPYYDEIEEDEDEEPT